jgi:hypothetical protein
MSDHRKNNYNKFILIKGSDMIYGQRYTHQARIEMVEVIWGKSSKRLVATRQMDSED